MRLDDWTNTHVATTIIISLYCSCLGHTNLSNLPWQSISCPLFCIAGYLRFCHNYGTYYSDALALQVLSSIFRPAFLMSVVHLARLPRQFDRLTFCDLMLMNFRLVVSKRLWPQPSRYSRSINSCSPGSTRNLGSLRHINCSFHDR